MSEHADDLLSSRESSGMSMRTWLYLGAVVLALMLIGLRDRIVDEGPQPGDRIEHRDPGSAKLEASSGAQGTSERQTKVEVVIRDH